MASTVTSREHTGDGSDKTWAYTFQSYQEEDIKVAITNAAGLFKNVTNFTIPDYSASSGTVTFNSTGVDSDVCESDGSPKTGRTIRIFRETDITSGSVGEYDPKATYIAGAAVKAGDLNNNTKQALYAAFEQRDQEIQRADIRNDSIDGTKIADNAIDSEHYVDGSIDLAHMSANSVDSDQYVDGSIDTAHIADLQVTTAKIANDAITNAKIVNQTISNSKLVPNSITASELATGSVGTDELINDAVTADKIDDDVINSEHIVAGAVDLEHMSANSVDSNQYVDGSIDTDHIANLQITTAKIADTAVTNAKIASRTIANDKLVENSITASELATDSVTGSELADNSVTNDKIVNRTIANNKLVQNSITASELADNAVGTGELAADAVTNVKIVNRTIANNKLVENSITASELAANSVTASELASNAVTNDKIVNRTIANDKLVLNSVTASELADNAVGTGEIADNSVTNAKIADGELKTLAGMQSGTASLLAGSTALTATLAEINTIVDGKAVHTTISNSDAHYPTSGAVVDYVAAQIAPIGGLEVIATDAAFPNTQPSSGVVISIADAGGLVVNGSGTSTTGRTLNGTTVTINGINSSYNSSTVTAGIGFLVSSTGSGQVYNFHKSVIRDQDILSISTDIDDFANRYRVGSSNPSSNNDAGDLFYNTGTNKLYTYDADTGTWNEAQSQGNHYISTLSPSFNGSLTDFTLSNAPSSAQQVILAINGVIQKPNAGTSNPSEGFALDGATVKLGAAPPTGSTYSAVVIGSSVNTGTPSDNTVSTAKLQNLAVTASKIATGAVENAKIGAGAVSAAKLASNAVENAKIATDAVTQSKIADNVIDEARLNVSNSPTNGQFLQAQSGNTGGLTWATVSAGGGGSTGTDYNDDVRVRFGTGNDLTIHHDGTDSHIINQTNDLILQSTGDDVYIKANDDFIAYVQGGAETAIVTRNNGEVELHYDGTKKFDTTSNGINVTGRLWASGDAGYGIILEDNVKIGLGTAKDLEIYHNGSHSYIKDSGTGNLVIQTNMLGLQAANGLEDVAKFTENAAVELFYDNSKKLETTSLGARVLGDLQMGNTVGVRFHHTGTTSIFETQTAGDDLLFKTTPSGGSTTERLRIDSGGKTTFYGDGEWGDNKRIRIGSDGDMQIWHDGVHTRILNSTGAIIQRADSVSWKNGAENETILTATANGAVELYYDNSKKFETTSWGALLNGDIKIGDNNYLLVGDGNDFNIKHDGSNTIFSNGTGSVIHRTPSYYQWYNEDGTETLAKFSSNGACQLYYNNSLKLETANGGVVVPGYVNLTSGGHIYTDDSGMLRMGAGSDFEAFHDGTNSYLRANSGGGTVYIQAYAENSIKCLPNAQVELYYDGTKKFNTTANGIDVYGNIYHYSGSLLLNSGGHVEIGNDSGRLKIGTGHDLVIFHNSSQGENVFDMNNSTRFKINGNKADDYMLMIENDGNDSNRHGVRIINGHDADSGTNYAIRFDDGDGTNVGNITHNNGTVSYGTFTAYHPCIVPDADNKSDGSNVYPYGTLLETTSIEYSKNASGVVLSRGIRYNVQKTQSANSRKVLGAYGSSMNDSGSGETNMHQALVLGDGHILCNNAGGNIEVGDGICSSSTAGIGQKATVNPSMIIGIAQEAVTFTGSETKLVAVQYGVQQFIPWT